MIEEVSRNEMLSTIHYMTEHFPYRLAGSPCEAAASRYVTERLKQYGLEVENKEFYTYNSDPMYSKVTVLEPEMEIDSLPCAHIRATKPEGEIFELIYVGNGDYAAYKDIDVTGKMVLVEVSYAPPVPEKARIAYEMGAAGIMCMNWGNDEEVICRRGLKGVWGNPTEANFHCIPEIVGVGVTRGAGLKLKQLCLEGRKVEVKVTAIADRTWSIVHQPTAILHGNGSSDEFLLVCSHLDAWKPGVTCNATGNATTLEICRILSKHRQELDRDVYFVFWDGHEVAEAAGSTWFVDNNWDNLNKHCVCYMHIDSTGVKETELYEIKASEELLGLAKKNINEVLPELELRAMALKKIGDQSFMGIGVSSITQRKSFTKEYMEHAHGATLGWWNHTIEDGEDKCDPVALEEDTRATLKVLYDLATAKLLPYDFSDKISVFRANVQKVADKFGDHMDFTDLQDNLKTVEHQVNEIQAMKEGLSNEQAKLYNEFVKMVARQITNVTMTCADKYSQDSYGYTSLSYPIPLFADFERLVKLDPASLEYDKPASLGVTITKRGNAQVMAGQSMRYDLTVANTSNVPLESFFWHDKIPYDVARPTTLTTGTYSARLNYRILYKTNCNTSYQVLASNLLTSNNYSFSLNAIPMQAGEVVTDIYFDFGKVPVGFQSVVNPTLSVMVNGNAVNGYQMVNRADVGGKYQGTWQTATASWVTIIRRLWNTPTLPKTGY